MVGLDRRGRGVLTELASLEANVPADTGNADTLMHQPEIEVRLGPLPTDRLRRLLDAFAVQISHDVRTSHVAFQATVSEYTAPHLATLARAAVDRPGTRR